VSDILVLCEIAPRQKKHVSTVNTTVGVLFAIFGEAEENVERRTCNVT
jgi:hypothetical protein